LYFLCGQRKPQVPILEFWKSSVEFAVLVQGAGIAKVTMWTGGSDDADSTPAHGATELTVAVVFRTISAGVGGRSTGWGGAAGIIGQRYNTDGYYWGFGFTRIGQACGGVRNAAVGTTAYGAPRGLNDGQPHVAILTWGTNVAMTVDGYCESFSNTLENIARAMTRMTFGTIEHGSYFCRDIAEIRFYKDVELSPAQRRALGKELAAKYGAETVGYLAGETAFPLARKSVKVGNGATLAASGTALSIARRSSVQVLWPADSPLAMAEQSAPV
jgi:hypothetical protein